MILGAFLPGVGHHAVGWRLPEAHARGGLDVKHFISIASIAEAAGFDFIFLADGVAAAIDRHNVHIQCHNARVTFLEPLTLLSALSMTTSHIGLVATASTTHNEPFHVARKFASLDHISGGRAGWNVVTSATDAEARNFGSLRQPDPAIRYARAEEFVDAVIHLWDAWDDDAIICDKRTGRFFDPARLKLGVFESKNFRIQGPLNIARPPQGHPVIFQAGSSAAGQRLAARTGEVIFTAQWDMNEAIEFRHRLQRQAATFGRSPADIKVLPGLSFVVGRTVSEAQRKLAALEALLPTTQSIALLSSLVGVDLASKPLDARLTPLEIDTANTNSRQSVFRQLAAVPGTTVRDLARIAALGSGHLVCIGTGSDIANTMDNWVKAGAADGFNVMPTHLPGSLEDFVEHVLPSLRKLYPERGGQTLRERLQLKRPPAVQHQMA